MAVQQIRTYFSSIDLRQQQTQNITFITFWSQFSVYALNTVLVLFLTRPLFNHGLGYSEAKAYAFIGVTQACNFLMPVLGGFMADKVIGVRRSILLGSIMLAFAYLLVMISGYTMGQQGDYFFIAAYAFIPVTNSLLMGTASSLISHIYSEDAIEAKSAMTFYYMAINVGSLLAILLAPILLESPYGPLSVLTIAFIGKSIAALNFAKRYSLYDTVIWGKDRIAFPLSGKFTLVSYIAVIYTLTLLAYSHIEIANVVIGLGCFVGIAWFFSKTLMLSGEMRIKQLLAVLLILEAVVFFVIYNQMNTTLVIFAQNNSSNTLLGIAISPAHYQLLNPLLILLIGSQLPRFYKKTPGFSIPYQFAAGTLLAGFALMLMAFASNHSTTGYINGNMIALTYILITIAELWVSAIGLSMIGLYCDTRSIAFAMGVWYLACSLSNTISGHLAGLVAIPESIQLASERLPYYYHYYLNMGTVALIIGAAMWLLAFNLHRRFYAQGMKLA